MRPDAALGHIVGGPVGVHVHQLDGKISILDRGGRSIIGAIEAPKNEWKGVIDIYSDVLAHERKITASINNLVKVAREESDFATENFLQWFISEQVEEEANVSDVLEQLKMIDGKGAGIFMLDRELKLRVFVPIDSTK